MNWTLTDSAMTTLLTLDDDLLSTLFSKFPGRILCHSLFSDAGINFASVHARIAYQFAKLKSVRAWRTIDILHPAGLDDATRSFHALPPSHVEVLHRLPTFLPSLTTLRLPPSIPPYALRKLIQTLPRASPSLKMLALSDGGAIDEPTAVAITSLKHLYSLELASPETTAFSMLSSLSHSIRALSLHRVPVSYLQEMQDALDKPDGENCNVHRFYVSIVISDTIATTKTHDDIKKVGKQLGNFFVGKLTKVHRSTVLVSLTAAMWTSASMCLLRAALLAIESGSTDRRIQVRRPTMEVSTSPTQVDVFPGSEMHAISETGGVGPLSTKRDLFAIKRESYLNPSATASPQILVEGVTELHCHMGLGSHYSREEIDDVDGVFRDALQAAAGTLRRFEVSLVPSFSLEHSRPTDGAVGGAPNNEPEEINVMDYLSCILRHVSPVNTICISSDLVRSAAYDFAHTRTLLSYWRGVKTVVLSPTWRNGSWIHDSDTVLSNMALSKFIGILMAVCPDVTQIHMASAPWRMRQVWDLQMEQHFSRLRRQCEEEVQSFRTRYGHLEMDSILLQLRKGVFHVS